MVHWDVRAKPYLVIYFLLFLLFFPQIHHKAKFYSFFGIKFGIRAKKFPFPLILFPLHLLSFFILLLFDFDLFLNKNREI